MSIPHQKNVDETDDSTTMLPENGTADTDQLLNENLLRLLNLPAETRSHRDKPGQVDLFETQHRNRPGGI